MSKVIRYYLQGAHESGIRVHPQKHMIDLGIKVSKFEGAPIADLVMMEVDKLPDPLPDYIDEVDWKFTE